MNAKVVNILKDKVASEWKRFARGTYLNDVDVVVDCIDHDVDVNQRGHDHLTRDKSKIEFFLKELIQQYPNNYMIYIKKSLEEMRRNDILQDIAFLGDSIPLDCEYAESNIDWKGKRLIGSGAFGKVYLCKDLNTDKKLAVKYIEFGLIYKDTSKEVEMLQQEINLYKTLNHERIVKYFNTLRTDTSLSIILEYMEGGSIHDKVSNDGALDEKETSIYSYQVLEGIVYLHSKNIIHRDIKGANILLDSGGNCKLADFGVSKRIQTISSNAGCKSQQGTPYWMSPEVIKGENYGRKADIWSFGCTVLEMLTTKPPWSWCIPWAAMFKIGNELTIPHLPDGSSPECKKFVDDCFNKDPSLRPKALELLSYTFVQRR